MAFRFGVRFFCLAKVAYVATNDRSIVDIVVMNHYKWVDLN